MRFWCLLQQRASNAKASLCKCADLPEPSLLTEQSMDVVEDSYLNLGL